MDDKKEEVAFEHEVTFEFTFEGVNYRIVYGPGRSFLENRGFAVLKQAEDRYGKQYWAEYSQSAPDLRYIMAGLLGAYWAGTIKTVDLGRKRHKKTR